MKNKTEGLQIKHASELTGIDPHTIRVWEKRYKILNPIRRGNRRIYSSRDILKLKQLNELTQSGNPIRLASKLTDEEREKKCSSLHSSSNEKHRRESLISHLKNYDLKRVNEFLLRMSKKNTEHFLHLFITPLLQDIGLLVESKQLNIAQEHALCSLIKSRILQIRNPKALENLPTFAFCTPEGDFHELGILIAQKIAESRHFNTLSFGTNLPAHALVDIINACRPNIVVIGTTAIPTNLRSFHKYIKEVSKNIKVDTKLWIAGSMAESYKNKFLTVGKMSDFMNHLNDIRKSPHVSKKI